MNRQSHPAVSDLTAAVYREYQAKSRMQSYRVWLTQAAIVAACLLLWETAGRMKWIDVLLFSYPSKIVYLLWTDLKNGSLWPHIGMTVMETVIGFILGTVLGTAFAALLWWSRFLARVLDPFIVMANSMPKVALGPLFIVAIGPNMMAVVATTLAVTVIITTLVVHASFKEVDANYVKVVRLFGGNRKQIFRKVVLPASLPTIISALKVNVGLAWIGVVVGEFLVSKQGLGYLIIYGFQVFNFTLVFASLLIIAVAATAMYQAVAYIERRFQRK